MTVFDFSGKVVLVTGGTKGIGSAIAQAFSDAGATVYVCGRTPPSSVATDSQASSQTCMQAALPEDTPRFTEAVIRLNLLAPLQIAQRANALMHQQPEGDVLLFIGSVNGLRASPGTATYDAAKAGLLNAVRSLAVEWAPKVRVCAVSPSLVETEAATSGHTGASAADSEAALDNISATIPAGRLAKPGDIASVCLFLASPHTRLCIGQQAAAKCPPFSPPPTCSRHSPPNPRRFHTRTPGIPGQATSPF